MKEHNAIIDVGRETLLLDNQTLALHCVGKMGCCRVGLAEIVMTNKKSASFDHLHRVDSHSIVRSKNRVDSQKGRKRGPPVGTHGNVLSVSRSEVTKTKNHAAQALVPDVSSADPGNRDL